MKEFLDKCANAYYTGSPIISDEEYDAIQEQYNHYVVGHAVSDGYPHLYPMYSLQKTFDLSDAPVLGGLSLSSDYVESVKLDGAAVSITYVNGQLGLALTRGDGSVGKDITEKMKVLAPTTINLRGTYQITGEVVTFKYTPNARNFAAGSLGLKNDQEGLETFKQRSLFFYAYGIQEAPPGVKTYTESMELLQKLGFLTVLNKATAFPTDGTVYRVNDNTKFDSLGYTSNHPRGAFALKEKKSGEITKLKDVLWQVGKSGVVSPVAIFDPVDIDGAVVTRATLHNIDYISGLKLELGCYIEVVRSGDIIPRVVRRVPAPSEK